MQKKTSPKACLFIRSILDGALDLVRAKASRTDVNMAGGTVNNRFHALDIGLPGSVGTSVRMGDLDPEDNTLAANITLSHGLHLLAG